MITVVFRSERTCVPCGSDHADGASASISTGGSDFRFWPRADVETRLSIRPLSEVKRTRAFTYSLSAFDPKPTLQSEPAI
jgi:hypothetical protein